MDENTPTKSTMTNKLCENIKIPLAPKQVFLFLGSHKHHLTIIINSELFVWLQQNPSYF